jgi:hypothetical protein
MAWLRLTVVGVCRACAVLQEEVSECSSGGVVLLCDPVATAMGELTLRAFRHVRGPLRKEEAEEIGALGQLVQELKVVVRNPGIVSAYLWDLQADPLVST